MSRPAPTAGSVAEELASKMGEGRFPAASWWIGGPAGVIEEGALGAATPGTPFDLASLTKPLCTALLGVLLEQEGALDLDAPVAELLPELAQAAVGRRTLLELGSHRAALPAWLPLSVTARSRAGMLDAIARAETGAGEEVYSDLGYILLGLALERAGGAPLNRQFHVRIAVPCGSPRIGFPDEEDRFTDAAPTEQGNAYERRLAGEAGTLPGWRDSIPRGEVHDANAHALDGVAGHAGLFGTAEAVGLLGTEILRPAHLPLGARARERLLSPVVPGADRAFGLVLARGSHAARGVLPDTAPGHTGFTGTSLWLLPESEHALVLLTNRVHPVVSQEDFQPVRAAFHARALRRLA